MSPVTPVTLTFSSASRTAAGSVESASFIAWSKQRYASYPSAETAGMISGSPMLTRYSLKPLIKLAASSFAGAASSKNVERTTPSASAPAFSIIVAFSHVSPAAITAVIPISRACLMISGAVVIDEGAKIISGLADLMFVRIALKSDWFVWNCSSVTIVPPRDSKAVLKYEPRPDE